MINNKQPFYTTSILKNNGNFKNWLVSIDGLAYKKVKGSTDIVPVINTATGLQFTVSKKALLGMKLALSMNCKNIDAARVIAKNLHKK